MFVYATKKSPTSRNIASDAIYQSFSNNFNEIYAFMIAELRGISKIMVQNLRVDQAHRKKSSLQKNMESQKQRRIFANELSKRNGCNSGLMKYKFTIAKQHSSINNTTQVVRSRKIQWQIGCIINNPLEYSRKSTHLKLLFEDIHHVSYILTLIATYCFIESRPPRPGTSSGSLYLDPHHHLQIAGRQEIS
ncbi:hypothetical protein AVEN_61353-1 [Araneus ventricosus]|uniref:Uncharacterized protein n=1 Tax=Araneus ventricosus TaxID=182803 RepID=A0A4Y2MZJ8_ARAVE|nr:hypothetical protein AVEN_61353-1 [Araneus ventricosus]